MPMLPAMAVMASGPAPTMAQMRDDRRVLVIAAPAADDPRLRAQRATLAAWGGGVADRDLTVVEVVGRVISGAADDAASLRAAYRLMPGAFVVLLVGKDGHVAYRAGEPVKAEKLQAMIDAMPMRRAGRR